MSYATSCAIVRNLMTYSDCVLVRGLESVLVKVRRRKVENFQMPGG